MSQSHVVCTYWIEESFGYSMNKRACYHVQTSLTIEGVAASLAAKNIIPWFENYQNHLIDSELYKFLSKHHAVVFDSISHYGSEHLCSVKVWWDSRSCKWQYVQFMPEIKFMRRWIDRNLPQEKIYDMYNVYKTMLTSISAGENFCIL